MIEVEPPTRLVVSFDAMDGLSAVEADYLQGCTPGYYNAEGGTENNAGFLQGHYPEGGLKFYEMLAQWRADGKFEGLTVRR